jgi:diguanylate cyclase (GGDEF)-like protein/PAS domain S-box-containing protein
MTRTSQQIAATRDTSRRHLLTIFLRLFSPLAILIVGVALLYGQTEIERDLSRLKSQEALGIGLGTGALSRNLDDLTRDLTFLASHSALRAAVDSPTPQNLGHLEGDFSAFSRSKGLYDQLRWIDEKGMEIVRVDYINGKATVIEANQLQNKGQRYFFTDTFKLNLGEIFISPLDLNIEQNKIEIPYKPMLRIATPVANQQGVKRGIVILNFFGRVMLDSFAKATASITDHAMILNSQGYWLKSPKTADEWGFMFKRSDLSMAKVSPSAWAEIISSDSGQKTLADGLWTWQTVHPLHIGQRSSTGAAEAFAPSQSEVESEQYFWKSVAHVPADGLQAIYQAIWLKITFVSALLLTLLGFGSWKLALAWAKQAEAEDEIRRLNVGLEQLVDKRTQDLHSKVAELDAEITERKRAVEDRRDQHELLQNILTTALDGYWLADTHGRLMDVNDAACAMLGYTKQEALCLNVSDIDVVDSQEVIDRRIRNMQLHGGDLFESRHRRKEGAIIQVEVSIRYLPLKSAFSVFIRDITQRKQAEEALKKSEDRLRSVFNAMSEGFSIQEVICDQAGKPVDLRFIEANPAFESQTGVKNVDSLGHTLRELFPQSESYWIERYGKVALTGEPTRFDAVFGPLNKHYQVSAFQTEPGRFGVTFMDISEIKRVEAELLKSEERWKFAIEGSGDGLWDWSVQTGKAFYSSRYKTMLGFADNEIGDTADEWTKRIHPDDAPGVFAALQPYLDGKPGSATVEFRMLCKDASWKWTQGRGMVVERDPDGKPLRMIGTNSDITERKQHQSQLEHIAHFDALTNLPNRVLLSDRLQQAMAQALRRSQQLAVVYLDLDGFKAINDRHSHAAGDQVLIALARRMKQALREGDSLARLGGDEFVAVLIDLEDQAACLPLLSRLLTACAQSVQVGELSLQVSASLGVTFYPQAQEIDPDQLLRQADQAMYQAKMAGKNRYHFFDAEQDSSIRGHHESIERIRLALQDQEFVLHYQPKVNMRSGQIIGAEALIRWQHPQKGLLAPAMFLSVIEDHALAISIGEWVIDTALTQIELWRAAGLDLGVSVNIGARQLQQSDFVDRLKFILSKHAQVKPVSLELEVLETSALEDIAQVSEVIEACAQIGIMFALDDFGTGYSSLTYLKRLRVQVLKIDQSFVRDMIDSPDDLAILQGVIGLAAAFKRDVIAEGVETVAHGTALLQLGCELAQGYSIARPMPPAQMPVWAATWRPDAAWRALPNSPET